MLERFFYILFMVSIFYNLNGQFYVKFNGKCYPCHYKENRVKKVNQYSVDLKDPEVKTLFSTEFINVDGFITKRILYSDSGSISIDHSFYYEDTTLIYEEHVHKDSKTLTTTYHHYDKKGRPIRMTFKSNGRLLSKHNIKWSKNNHSAVIKCRQVHSKRIFNFDQQGRIVSIEEKSRKTDDHDIKLITTKYLEDNKKETRYYFDQDSSLFVSEINTDNFTEIKNYSDRIWYDLDFNSSIGLARGSVLTKVNERNSNKLLLSKKRYIDGTITDHVEYTYEMH